MKRLILYSLLFVCTAPISACQSSNAESTYTTCPFCHDIINSQTFWCGFFDISLCAPWSEPEIVYGHLKCFFDALEQYREKVYRSTHPINLIIENEPMSIAHKFDGYRKQIEAAELARPVPTHITSISQINHRIHQTDSGEFKLDLFGLGITTIDGFVFEQLAQLRIPLRQIDISCNNIAELPMEIVLLPSSNLVLWLTGNPVTEHENYGFFMSHVKGVCPGWVIMDNKPDINIL